MESSKPIPCIDAALLSTVMSYEIPIFNSNSPPKGVYCFTNPD